ncbi:MAG: Uma2 family endonuclease [Planctomycetes bacterium]|nr:Uma2 family endonuclease [Planctomycetota bacterium]
MAALLEKLGPRASGVIMSPREFDRAEFVAGRRYELINRALVVSPIPSESETGPNEELGYQLLHYQKTHPQGGALDATLPEQTVRTGRNRRHRRKADRVIWAGLGRLPRKNEPPTIIAEVVSKGKRNQDRDYDVKRREYMAIRVQEYWIFDRFRDTMTVYSRVGGRIKKRVFREGQIYRTPLLPGFELPLAPIFTLARRWSRRTDREESA